VKMVMVGMVDVWFVNLPCATIGGLIGAVGEASADLLPDINANVVSKTTAAQIDLYTDNASGWGLGEAAMLARGGKDQAMPDSACGSLIPSTQR
jgi:hypothetical protein